MACSISVFFTHVPHLIHIHATKNVYSARPLFRTLNVDFTSERTPNWNAKCISQCSERQWGCLAAFFLHSEDVNTNTLKNTGQMWKVKLLLYHQAVEVYRGAGKSGHCLDKNRQFEALPPPWASTDGEQFGLSAARYSVHVTRNKIRLYYKDQVFRKSSVSFFSKTSTHPPIERQPGFSHRSNQPWHVYRHWFPCNVEINNDWRYTSTPSICVHDADRDHFAF